MLTPDEESLLKRLSKPPKCMHDPKFTSDLGKSYKCGQCGLIAEKSLVHHFEDIGGEFKKAYWNNAWDLYEN